MFYFGLITLMLRVYKGDKTDYYMSTLYLAPILLIGMIYKLQKVFAILLMMTAVFLSGYQMSKIKTSQELINIKQAVQLITRESKDNKVALLFHDDNFINIFAYAFDNFSDLEVVQRDRDLVEICGFKQRCRNDGILWCSHRSFL